MRTSYLSQRPASGEMYIHLFLLLVVCLFAFFLNNHVIPADIMEARNLATAQEMNRLGNYLIPTMNGELRLEKPPLPTWIAALVDQASPANLVVQRCVAGIAATLMVFFLYFHVSFLTRNRKLAVLAALVFATSYNIIMIGRTATWDIFCHSFMLGAIYFFTLACERKGSQWGLYLLAGFLAGLSFLSKGPIALYTLFIPYTLAYLFCYRPMLREKKAPIIAMIAVFLVVSFWWMGYLFVFNYDDFMSVMHKETTAWLNHNTRPWYYYWQFPAEAGIWAPFWVISIVAFFLFKRQALRKEYAFSLLWFTIALLLLSVVPEKKPRYLLPLLVPGALNISFFLYYCVEGMAGRGERRLFRISATLVALVLAVLPVGLYISYKQGILEALPAILILAGVLFWILAGIIFYSLYRNKKKIHAKPVIASIIGAMIVVEAFCIPSFGELFINPERKSIKELRGNTQVEKLPFYYHEGEELRIELVYELNKQIRPINPNDSIRFMHALPLVFVESLNSSHTLSGLPITQEEIGIFDNNWNKPDQRKYNMNLVRRVSIIRKK